MAGGLLGGLSLLSSGDVVSSATSVTVAWPGGGSNCGGGAGGLIFSPDTAAMYSSRSSTCTGIWLIITKSFTANFGLPCISLASKYVVVLAVNSADALSLACAFASCKRC